MVDNVKIFGSDKVLKELEKSENMVFACVLGNTAVSKIEGISGAGGSPEMTPYTPALDVELMLRNEALSLPEIAVTESDEVPAPTPGLLTKTTYELLNMPFVAISAGLEVDPKTSYISLNGQPGGDLREGKGVPNPKEIYCNAVETGKLLSQLSDHLMIGESTPAGTTTAQGVLTALGYDVEGKVSGCMMHNPHELKTCVVNRALEKNNVKAGDLKDDPFKAVEIAGDPSLIAIAGLAIGSSVPVTLAGGTQMTAALALIKAIKPDFDFSNIAIATTVYVANDETSNILDIVNQIGDIAVYAADPKMENSSNPGLASYAKGSVKEGVGAGGSVLYAYLKGITPEEYLAKLEELTAAVFG